MYVRVHGHISNFGRTQDVLAFNIRTVTDHNEVGPCRGERVCVFVCVCVCV